jgi:hypothetical protein
MVNARAIMVLSISAVISAATGRPDRAAIWTPFFWPFSEVRGGMAKGYGVGLVNVSDPEVYKAYVHENVVALKRFGARFLVRGGTQR